MATADSALNVDAVLHHPRSQQFRTERPQGTKAKSGRVWGKLCQPSDECSRACGQTATLLISINEADHPKLTERHLMELRNEIKNVILLAAQRVLSNTAGDLSAADEARLRANLEGRIPLYTERYPILNQYQGGMCISGRLTMTERTPRHLISPLGPNWVGTDSAV